MAEVNTSTVTPFPALSLNALHMLCPISIMVHTPCILDSNICVIHSWLPISSSILSCFPSYFIPLFFKLLFLCRLSFPIFPGPLRLILTSLSGIPLSLLISPSLSKLEISEWPSWADWSFCKYKMHYTTLHQTFCFCCLQCLRLDLDCMPANSHLQLEPSNRKPEIGTWSIFRLSLQKKVQSAFLLKRKRIIVILCTWKSRWETPNLT